MEERICEYRNCDKTIEGRSDKMFCNRNCKSNERTYRVRREEFLRKCIEKGKNIVNSYKIIEEIAKGRYKI